MEDQKKVYCSKTQKEVLIDLLKKDPQLISGKFTKQFTFKDARKRWMAIASTLNALPGCSKDWSQWKRTWQDSRTKVRSKKAMANRHLNGTGGGPQVSDTITPIDEQILELISPVTINGDENIPVPTTMFMFDDISIIDDVDVNHSLEYNGPGLIENDSPVNNSAVIIVPSKATINDNNATTAPVVKKNENKFPKTSSAKRLVDSLVVGKDICDIGQKKLEMKQWYYEKKLLLLERQTVALETIAVAKEQKLLNNI